MISVQFIINILLLVLIFLYIFSILAVTRIYSVVTLVLAYAVVAVIAMLYNQSFIAVIILMIYAGAISIFFLFMVMLLNTQRRGSGGNQISWSGALFFFLLLVSLGNLILEAFNDFIAISSEFDYIIIDQVVKDTGLENLVGDSQLKRIGMSLYTTYVYCFIGAGLLLLAAIVGATILFAFTPRLKKSRERGDLQILRNFKKK